MNSFIIDENAYELKEDEALSLKEANLFLDRNNNLYALYELYNFFYIHILRRIEYYNKEKVLTKLNSNNLYKEKEVSIFKRWENFKAIDIIKSIKHLKIINKIAYNLFLSFHHFKSKTSLEDVITTQYLCSFFLLLKEELLIKSFQKEQELDGLYKRRLSDNENIKRRKEDKQRQDRREKDKEEEKKKEESLINTQNLSPIAIKDLLNKKNINSKYEKKEIEEDTDKIIYI